MLLVTSPSALLVNGKADKSIADVLIEAVQNGYTVGVTSNQPKPDWFDELFDGTGVQFQQSIGRGDGGIVKRTAEKQGLAPQDALVLAASENDIAMGKNGKAVLVAAGWSTAPRVADLGIQVDSPSALREVLHLTSEWDGRWWFSGKGSSYSVHALSDLSTYGKDFDQQQFRAHLTNTIKNGGPRLNALLAITARSMLAEGIGTLPRLLWGVFPSSTSSNNDTEVLSDFTHRLRTTVSNVRMARRGEPLFIRHKPSTKRSSAGAGVNRLDPREQIESLHINPAYSTNISGRNVVLVDDCTTHGVSFGVASSLLYKAGAKSVTCVSLGKFGSALRDFQLEITGDPFKPLNFDQDAVLQGKPFLGGSENNAAQASLRGLLG
tara:strand:- start:3728 stop:4864 length:1137 start_codon:yes stop_codon:yes gene_type:complete